MENEYDVTNIGLRGISIADTRISRVNGKKGQVVFRGYDINDLVEQSNYEETAYLLLH